VTIYPDNLLEGIDYPEVKLAVAALTHTHAGKQAALNLVPTHTWSQLVHQLKETDQLLSVLQSGAGIPALAVEDLAGAFQLMKVKNAVLAEQQFLNIRALALNYENLYRFLDRQKQLVPLLWDRVTEFPPLPQVAGMIDRVFDHKGIVRSNASPLLAKIRDELTKKKVAADRIFYRTLGKYQSRGLLADFVESVMDERRVMAVNASFKGQVTGLFHGSSAKNSIVFVEPAETVEINNEIASLTEEEKREVYRILKELTASLAQHAPELKAWEERLCHVDFVAAKARYAFKTKSCLPHLVREPRVDLKDALNPVLMELNRSKGKPTIPLSLHLNAEERLLVISGPNAGGKSIALKTVALLQTMLQSGLLVPVNPRSTMGVFQVLAGDIGDAQSIENELSTYSSRLEKMKAFLGLASPHCLLVIDEFGSGSDPELGSSLAVVFLEELARMGTFGIATTHYQRIKAAAAQLPGVLNGAMEFDAATFEPLYHLHVGHPGSSYTFEVATRVGLPENLVQRAKAGLHREVLGLDELLTGLQTARLELDRNLKSLRDKLSHLETGKARNERELQRLEDKLVKQGEINAENNRLLYLGKKLDALLKDYMADPTDAGRKKVGQRFWAWMKTRAADEKGKQADVKQQEDKRAQARMKKLLEEPIAVGDTVKLLGSQQTGKVIDIKKNRYHVLFGNLQSVLERNKFTKVHKT
jgi:DNA mismatch repair protein MutS2